MKTKARKLENHIRPMPYHNVRVKETGNILELMYSSCVSQGPPILKLSCDEFIDLRTGELREYTHTVTRADNKKSVARSLSKLRDLLNCNITDVTLCRWLTLTYKDNMMDRARLMRDFKHFIERLRKRIGYFKYIVAAEPQGRGAWHLHVVLIFEEKAPFIPNENVSADWRQGFVTIKKLDNIDNVGAYLTAYLGDMDLEEGMDAHLISIDDVNAGDVKVIDYEENGIKKTKYYLKGARLKFYPPGFHLFRVSKGVVRPTVEMMQEFEARQKVRGATLTFEKTLSLSDEDKDFKSVLNYRYYNKKR